MAKIIKPGPRFMKHTCSECLSEIMYDLLKDLQWTDFWDFFVICPSCKDAVQIPRENLTRQAMGKASPIFD